MKWSFQMGRVGETAVKLHATFVLFVAWYAWGAYARGGTDMAVQSTTFLLSLFGCVLLHEFGHILMARHFGVKTPEVILLPIGGLARLERIPEEPKQELLIAIAGPAVTLLLALIFAAIVHLAGQPLRPARGMPETWPLPLSLWVVNVGLLIFNLIPAFPMDGGRVLRAALASRLGLGRATRIAANAGQLFAMVFGLWGLFHGELLLVLVAFFIYAGAGAEAQAVEARLAGRGLTVSSMMITRFETLPVHAPLQRAAELLLSGDQREFPVVDNFGRLEGLLTRENLIRGLSTRGPEGTVGEVMTAPVRVVPPTLPFEDAVTALRESLLPALPVVDERGGLVGLVSVDNLSELLQVRRAAHAG
ncbi:MAG: site-2 protease family protein [Gemmatimonadales bacterium]